MIQNERELEVTRARIEQFQRWLSQMCQTADEHNFEARASGYRLEIEKMQAEIMEYLMRPGSPSEETQMV